MKKAKKETYVSRVLAALRDYGDFITGKDLKVLLDMDTSHLAASLIHLRRFKCADVIEQEGKLYWFALPEEYDTRQRVVKERVEEEPGNRSKRGKRVNQKGRKHGRVTR